MRAILMAGWVFVLLILGLGGVAKAAEPVLPAVKDTWTEFRSPNFEMFSQGHDLESRLLLRNLEALRAVLLEQWHAVESSKTPLTVFYFGRRKDFQFYAGKPKIEIAAQYTAGPDRARALVPPDTNQFEHVMFFSYLQHAITSTNQVLPSWLRRGLSGVYSSVRREGDVLQIGLVPDNSVFLLRATSLTKLQPLFAAGLAEPKFDDARSFAAYADQCWLLVHFMMFSQNALPKGAGPQFIDWATKHPYAPEPEVRDALKRILQMDYDELSRQLKFYLDKGEFGWRKIPLPKLDDPSTYKTRKVPRDEMTINLASAAVVTAKVPEAETVLREASVSSRNPRVFESLGGLAYKEDDAQLVKNLYGRAIEMGSTNLLIHRVALQRKIGPWKEKISSGFEPAEEDLTDVEKAARRVIQQDTDQGIGYEALAWVNAFSPHPSLDDLKLIQQHLRCVSRRDEVFLALAFACFKLGKSNDARMLLDALAKADTDSWVQKCSEDLRATIDRRAPDYTHIRKSPRELFQDANRS